MAESVPKEGIHPKRVARKSMRYLEKHPKWKEKWDFLPKSHDFLSIWIAWSRNLGKAGHPAGSRGRRRGRIPYLFTRDVQYRDFASI